MEVFIEHSFHRGSLSLLKISDEIIKDWALVIHVFAFEKGKYLKDVLLTLPRITIIH